MKRLLFALAAGACLLAPAQAQSVAPRDVVESVAASVAENYFDPARGETIAQDLRTRAAAGAFDRFTNPQDLAATLAAILQPYDAHFQVNWEAEAQAPAPGAPPPSADAAAELAARGNYGFARTELFPGGVAYIDVRGFADFRPETAETSPARRAADAAMLATQGAGATIVDLRDCAGGSPAMVGYLASYFAPEGADIYNTFHSRGGEGSEAPFVPINGERRLNTPLFILTSGRTASACEAFAYTLQAAQRATIVGSPSAGGANPGGFAGVGQGFSVFISRASPRNPITHANWEGAGVPLNVTTTAEDALARARILALEAQVQTPQSEAVALETRWALAALQAEANPQPRNLRQYAGDYGARSIAVENGRLVLHRDRRPGLTLLPLEADLFAIDGALPLQRLRFERDARGRVIAFTLSLANGPEFRNTRVS